MSLSVVVLHLGLTVEEVPSKSVNIAVLVVSRRVNFKKTFTTTITYRDQMLLGIIYVDQNFTLKYDNSFTVK